jgi:multidrug efflux pump subunit AcrB
MMTTLAALFGALPLVLSGGDGSSCASRWGSPLSAVW